MRPRIHLELNSLTRLYYGSPPVSSMHAIGSDSRTRDVVGGRATSNWLSTLSVLPTDDTGQ